MQTFTNIIKDSISTECCTYHTEDEAMEAGHNSNWKNYVCTVIATLEPNSVLPSIAVQDLQDEYRAWLKESRPTAWKREQEIARAEYHAE